MSHPELTAPRWSFAQCTAFRFSLLYLGLYAFPFPLVLIPDFEEITEPIYAAWERVVAWVGTHVLHLDAEFKNVPSGSGDSLFSWVSLFTVLMLAMLGTVIWSALDRRRVRRPWLEEGLRVYLRYYLAASLVTYGMMKAIPVQFWPPTSHRLLETYGESSPMGLLWTFMGASRPYTMFAGTVELVAGLLLFFRRTTMLGTLLAAAAMTHVVVLNFCYDVPVKIYSSHLLLVAGFLLLPDARRLTRFLVLNLPTAPAKLHAPLPRPWMERSRVVAKALFASYIVLSAASDYWKDYRDTEAKAQEPGLNGTYEVEAFLRDGKEVPPLLTDASRWRTVSVMQSMALVPKFMDGKRVAFRMQEDAEKGTLALAPFKEEGAPSDTVTYARPDPEHLVLAGTLQGEKLEVRMRKVEPASMLLVNRGFHWVNEFPFNR